MNGTNARSSGDSDERESAQRPIRSRLWRILRSVLICYLLILLIMMLLENYLIFPARRYPAGDWRPAELAVEEVHFLSEDGTRLHGWYVAHPKPKAHVLFCHGNAEHVADLAWQLREYHEVFDVCVFAFDYRGYGRSEGKPAEHGVLADGHAAHQWIAQREGITPAEVVLIGRSLGGAVAVELAAKNGARGLVLERTFTSMPDVAARHYPFLPVRWLMKTQFNSLSKIRSYNGPLLQSHGTIDLIIPIDLGRRLFDAAPSSDKQFFQEDDVGHNDAYSTEYLQALYEFLSNLPN